MSASFQGTVSSLSDSYRFSSFCEWTPTPAPPSFVVIRAGLLFYEQWYFLTWDLACSTKYMHSNNHNCKQQKYGKRVRWYHGDLYCCKNEKKTPEIGIRAWQIVYLEDNCKKWLFENGEFGGMLVSGKSIWIVFQEPNTRLYWAAESVVELFHAGRLSECFRS